MTNAQKDRMIKIANKKAARKEKRMEEKLSK